MTENAQPPYTQRGRPSGISQELQSVQTFDDCSKFNILIFHAFYHVNWILKTNVLLMIMMKNLNVCYSVKIWCNKINSYKRHMIYLWLWLSSSEPTQNWVISIFVHKKWFNIIQPCAIDAWITNYYFLGLSTRTRYIGQSMFSLKTIIRYFDFYIQY